MIFHVIAASCCRQMELMTRNVKTTPRRRQECNKIRNRGYSIPYSSNTAFRQLSSKGACCGVTSGRPLILSATCAHTSGNVGCPSVSCRGETVNLSSPVCIVIRGGLNKTIKSINYLTTSHDYYTDAAHAGASAIGCFKVYCYKILHCQSLL